VLRLHTIAAGAGHVEWDDVSVREVYAPETRFKSDWGAYATTVTTAAGGPLANTPFQVSTGSFRMVMDTIQGHTVKAIECVTAGIIYLDESLLHQGPEQRSYGTWTFYLSHADASTTNVHFISSDAVGTAGYRLTITATEQIQLYEVGIGEKFITAADYVSAGYHKYTITRRQRDGLFNVYMDNTFVDTATDNSTTTSAFWLWDLDAGDRGSWSNLTGDMCIMKQDGVNP